MEFKGNEESEQYDSLMRTQILAKERLGISLVSFGAPFNATDGNTASALAHIPEIKIWMFKETDVATGKKQLIRAPQLNIESPVHTPNYEKFVTEFPNYEDRAIITIQGHPRSWADNPKRWEDFTKIIQFLKKQNIKFTTPRQLLEAEVI